MKPLLGSPFMTPAPYIVGPMPREHRGMAACAIYLIPKELMRPLGDSPTSACHHSTPTAQCSCHEACDSPKATCACSLDTICRLRSHSLYWPSVLPLYTTCMC